MKRDPLAASELRLMVRWCAACPHEGRCLRHTALAWASNLVTIIARRDIWGLQSIPDLFLFCFSNPADN